MAPGALPGELASTGLIAPPTPAATTIPTANPSATH